MAKEVIPTQLVEIPAGEAGTRMYLHAMEGRMTRLETQFAEFKQEAREESDEIRDEQRTVHNIVEATNESIRNVARDITEMKPYVKEYSFASADLKDTVRTVRAIRDKQSEERGALRERAKTKAIVVSALGVIGAGIMYLMSKFVDWFVVYFTNKPK